MLQDEEVIDYEEEDLAEYEQDEDVLGLEGRSVPPYTEEELAEYEDKETTPTQETPAPIPEPAPQTVQAYEPPTLAERLGVAPTIKLEFVADVKEEEGSEPPNRPTAFRSILAPGWRPIVSKSGVGDVHYFNETTGQTVWFKPLAHRADDGSVTAEVVRKPSKGASKRAREALRRELIAQIALEKANAPTDVAKGDDNSRLSIRGAAGDNSPSSKSTEESGWSAKRRAQGSRDDGGGPRQPSRSHEEDTIMRIKDEDLYSVGPL